MSTQHVVFERTETPENASSQYTFSIHSPEFHNNPEYAPQPESRVEVPAYNQRAGVKSSSEYFTCVSSRSKLPRGNLGKEYVQVGSELGQEMQPSCAAQSLLSPLSPQKQEGLQGRH